MKEALQGLYSNELLGLKSGTTLASGLSAYGNDPATALGLVDTSEKYMESRGKLFFELTTAPTGKLLLAKAKASLKGLKGQRKGTLKGKNDKALANKVSNERQALNKPVNPQPKKTTTVDKNGKPKVQESDDAPAACSRTRRLASGSRRLGPCGDAPPPKPAAAAEAQESDPPKPPPATRPGGQNADENPSIAPVLQRAREEGNEGQAQSFNEDGDVCPVGPPKGVGKYDEDTFPYWDIDGNYIPNEGVEKMLGSKRPPQFVPGVTRSYPFMDKYGDMIENDEQWAVKRKELLSKKPAETARRCLTTQRCTPGWACTGR